MNKTLLFLNLNTSECPHNAFNLKDIKLYFQQFKIINEFDILQQCKKHKLFFFLLLL